MAEYNTFSQEEKSVFQIHANYLTIFVTDLDGIFQFMTEMNAVVTHVRMEALVTMELIGTRAPAHLDSLE